jgi:hypothetical protein
MVQPKLFDDEHQADPRFAPRQDYRGGAAGGIERIHGIGDQLDGRAGQQASQRHTGGRCDYAEEQRFSQEHGEHGGAAGPSARRMPISARRRTTLTEMVLQTRNAPATSEM